MLNKNAIWPILLLLCGTFLLASCDHKNGHSTPIATSTAILPTLTPNSNDLISPETISALTVEDRWGEGDFYGVALSPDGKTVAVATTSGVYLYDKLTFQLKQFIDEPLLVKAYSGYVINQAISFSPDGNLLAFGKDDIIIWNLLQNKKEDTIENLLNNYEPIQIQFSPNGKTIAVMSMGSYYACDAWGGNFTLINIRSHAQLYSDYFCPESGDYFFNFTKNGKIIFVGDSVQDYQTSIVDASTGTLLKRVGYADNISSISYDGSKVTSVFSVESNSQNLEGYSGSQYKTKIIDLSTHQIIKEMDGSLLFLNDTQNRQLLYKDYQWTLLDSKQKPLCSFVNSPSLSFDYIISPYSIVGDELIYGDQNSRKIYIWNLSSCQQTQSFTISNMGYSIQTADDGKMLLIQDNNSFDLWNVKEAQKVTIISNIDNIFHLSDLAKKNATEFEYDATTQGKKILIFTSDEFFFTFIIWDLDLGKIISTTKTDYSWVKNCLLSPDQKTVAFSDRNGVHLWDRETNRERLFLPGSPVYSFKFSTNSDKIIVVSGNKVTIYNSYTGNVQNAYDDYFNQAYTTFSPDSQYMVKETNYTLELYDLDGKLIRYFEENPPILLNPKSPSAESRNIDFYSDNPYSKFTFSSDNKLLLGIINESNQSILRFWDVESGRQIRDIVFPLYISDAVFSPDGKALYTSSNGMIFVWQISSFR